jgi:hypothetical protein
MYQVKVEIGSGRVGYALTVDEYAVYAGISRAKAYRVAAAGGVRTVMVEGRMYVVVGRAPAEEGGFRLEGEIVLGWGWEVKEVLACPE